MLMIIRQIRTQLIIIIFCFLLLILGSFTASYFYIQDHDAEEITQDFIHDHRITIQRLTWLSLVEPDNPSIPQLRIDFKNNLNLMVNQVINHVEGDSFRLPNKVDDVIRREYNSITQLWPDYVSQLEIVQAQPVNSPERTESWLVLQGLERQIVNGIDLVANAYDNFIFEQHKEIELLLILFILVAIPLVIIGIYVIGNKIIKPIELLNQSANRIKKGDLVQPVIAMWEDEIGQLAHSMDAMRIEIAANKQFLEEKIAERTHELTVATKFSQEISHKMNEEEIIKSAIKQAKKMLHVNEVSFCLLSEDDKCLQLIANGSGLLSSKKPKQPLINEFAITHSNKTQITNIADSRCKFLKADQNGIYLSSTLQVGEKVIGEMCVQRDIGLPFDENEIQAFSLLTNSAAIAIYNNHLVEIGKDQAKQSARLTERQHIAAELHDDLAQNLGVSKMQVGQIIKSLSEKNGHENIEALEKLKKNLDIATEQVRQVISGLSTNQKDKLLGLKDEIDAAIADFQELCDIPVFLKANESSWENATLLIQRQLLLILRESLVNIRRHANAKTVQINIFRDQYHLVLNIKDDGEGINLNQAVNGEHFGLKIMHARAERSGGSLIIHSEPGDGTSLTATFPLESVLMDRHETGEGQL